MVLNGEVEKALYQIKSNKNEKIKNFFEADLLLILENFKKKNLKKIFIIKNLKKHNNLTIIIN